MSWPDESRTAVEDALEGVQNVVRLIEAGEISTGQDELSSLRATVHTLRLIADKIDRGGDAILFP